MKKVFAFLLMFSFAMPAFADEGMWLLLLLGKKYDEMKKMGLKLKLEDIYSVNKSSLKDAVIQLRSNGRGFCTGEIISKEGLILTNHHCAYGQIQSHSTPEKDLLTNGFWAMNKKEELPNKGLEASFLVRMEDVTARVLGEMNDNMSEADRRKKFGEVAAKIKKETEEAEKAKGNTYEANVSTFFDGNEYYLFVYEVFKDVRLVGAPHESVGKFGGDTDNWMWPRHTGDFSLLRVYADKNGKPAEYSADNVPFKPRHHFPISLNGIKEGDFTMVFGFPGRTNRFLTSYGVDYTINKRNPAAVKLRDKRLALMKDGMDKSPAVRLQYASKYASIANYWKNWLGETQCLKRLNVYAKKQAEEQAFAKWASADATRQAKYGKVLSELENAHKSVNKYGLASEYLNEGLFAPELLPLARGVQMMVESGKTDDLANTIKEHFKDYNVMIDQNIMASLYEMSAEGMPMDLMPDFLKDAKSMGFAKYAEMVYSKSIFASESKMNEFAKKPSKEAIADDPALKIVASIMKIAQTFPTDYRDVLSKNNRLYVAGTRELNKDKFYYPNANSTPRLTYGKVGAYKARDAVNYQFLTTLEGIMEKEDPTNPEFVIPEKLRQVYKAKDFGRYEVNGTVPVAFISNNDITGGNSGSPVINAEGQMIGCAFDGNWEAMSGNIAFETNLQRCINVDIRYVLFTIEKIGGAKNLIDEMTLVGGKGTKSK